MKNTNLVNKINEMNVQELSIEGLKATRKRVDDLLTMFTVGCVEDAKEAAQNKINEIDARIEELEAPVVEEVVVEEETTRTINGAIKNAKEITTGERLSNLIKSYVKKPQEGPQEAPKCEKVVYNVDILESLKNEVKQASKNLERAIKDYCNNYISYTEYYEFKKILGSKRGKLAAYEVQCGVWKSRKRI